MMIAQNIHNDRSSVFNYMRYIKRIYRLNHIDDIFELDSPPTIFISFDEFTFLMI